MISAAQAIMLAAASFIVGALSLAAYYDWQCGRRMAARAQRAYERVERSNCQGLLDGSVRAEDDPDAGPVVYDKAEW